MAVVALSSHVLSEALTSRPVLTCGRLLNPEMNHSNDYYYYREREEWREEENNTIEGEEKKSLLALCKEHSAGKYQAKKTNIRVEENTVFSYIL